MLSLEINLSDYISGLAKDRSQQRALQSIVNSPAVKSIFAQEILDKIVNRTKSGLDKKGNEFKPYSKNYVDSYLFQAYSKDKGTVDLTLTGDMLAGLNFKIGSRDSVVIFIERDQEKKAEGHIKGTYSKSGKRHLPKRDFFGVSKDEAQDALKKAVSEYNSSNSQSSLDQFTTEVSVNTSDFETTIQLSELL